MEEVNLPTEVAQEPEEEACISQSQTMNKIKGVTYAEATPSSQNSTASAYKDILSQPAPSLTHRERLLWLQRRRKPGLWVQCDNCDKWRYLANIIDAHQLPDKWQCSLNPDKSAADCSIPEKPLRVREEEDLIHGEYSAGSVVWARLAGWPWWPAMVDDCPDTEQYYWLDGFSDIPTHYHVVFFDEEDVTRAWIAPENLKPFGPNKKCFTAKQSDFWPKAKNQQKRVQVAVNQAESAEKLPFRERLAKYSFLTTYSGTINKPKKVTKKHLRRFQKQLKRKFNIDFPVEDLSEEDDYFEDARKEPDTTVIKKGNVLLVGTPKSIKKKKSRINRDEKQTNTWTRRMEDLVDTQETKEASTSTVDEQQNTIDYAKDTFKQPNSLLVQVGSTVTSTVVADVSLDNADTSYVPESESENEMIGDSVKAICTRAMSPSSDDFDF